MREPGIDYHAIFEASPSAMLVLNCVFVIVDANPSYQNLVGRTRDELIGKYVFDAFPQNDESEMEDLKASLRRVLESRDMDVAGPMRHDLEEPDRPGVFAERYWSPLNAPVLDSDGQVALIVHRLEEITDLVRIGGPDTDHRRRQMKLELYARSRELQQVNERLRQANARERQIALALQDSMLPAPQALAHHQAAVRYRPAVHALNVCGDWYDVTQLSNGKYAVAVGDVVGHGLAAAGVMGQLRSALSAAIRVVGGPASALDGLDLYARSVAGALSTTAVQTVIAWADHRITYSSATTRPRPWPTPTAPSASWTRRPTRHSGRASNTPPAPGLHHLRRRRHARPVHRRADRAPRGGHRPRPAAPRRPPRSPWQR